MKFAIRLLLISAIAIAPLSCNRDTPDESVSANVDNNNPNEPQPNNTANERTVERQRQTTRETGPAYRAPAKPPTRPAPSATADNRRTEDRASMEARERIQPNERVDRPVETTPARRSETVTDGTALTVTLADTISTETNKEGDAFTAHLSQPIVVNGKVVAEKGDRVTGHITELDEPGRVKGRARLELVLDEIRTSRNTYKLSTEPFIAVAEDTHERDAAGIAGGAGVGAAIGAIAGGKKGAAIGAVIGGGSGTTAVLLTKGKQLKLEPETKVNFVLRRDVDLPVIRNSSS